MALWIAGQIFVMGLFFSLYFINCDRICFDDLLRTNGKRMVCFSLIITEIKYNLSAFLGGL